MTRKLTFVATTGLIGAAAFLALGTTLAGSSWVSPAYLRNGGATCAPASGTQRQVTLPFASEDRLVIEAPGAVRYSPGEEAEAVISGDSALIDHLKIESGRLGLDCDPGWFASRFDVKLSGPAITRWDLRGNVDLTLAQIDQPQLQVSIKDRQRAGIDSAKAMGTYKGRKKNVDDVEIRKQISAGATKAAVARDLNVSRMTIYRALADQSAKSETL